MFRLLILFVLLVTLAGAVTNQDILERASRLSKSTKSSELFRAYNDYKNLYLRALMKGNNDLKETALDGIVQTGQKLHIDVKEYEKALDTLGGAKKQYALKPVETPAPKLTTKTLTINSLNKLVSANWNDDALILNFDKELQSDQVQYYTSYDKRGHRYHYTFDIDGVQLVQNQNLSKQGVSHIQLQQLNSKTVRLVFENQKKININFALSSSILTINLISNSFAKPTKTIINAVEKTKTEVVEDDASAFDDKYSKKVNRNKIIVIDPGHGGKDSGAIGYKHYYEKDLVLDISRDLYKILKARGYRVYMTRDHDNFIKLKERTAMANRKDADLFISIHANAVCSSKVEDACGIETYFLSPSRSKRATNVAMMENSSELEDMNSYGKSTYLKFTTNMNRIASNKLAIDLQRGMLSNLRKYHTHVVDAGVREGPFWVLVGAQMPAVLVEVGFITNPEESSKLKSNSYQKNLAYGIASGVASYFSHN